YFYDEGTRINTFRVNQDGRLGTIISTNLALGYNLRSKKKSGTKNLDNVSEDQQSQFESLSDAYVDFTIPWQMNISYNVSTFRSAI
ncbi:MAG TPA: hypothetical protein DCF89_13085, partial [Flavobacteriales bacterium]|nr:hypothetical protein [Flavobacteriales bacterium]